MRGVAAALLISRSNSRKTLELLSMEVECRKETGTPFQVLKRRSRELAEIVYILFLDRDSEGLAHVETIVGKLHGSFVGDHLVLFGLSIILEDFLDECKAEAPTLTRTRMVRTVPKTPDAGKTSAAFLSSISILSLKRDTWALRVSVAISTDLG